MDGVRREALPAGPTGGRGRATPRRKGALNTPPPAPDTRPPPPPPRRPHDLEIEAIDARVEAHLPGK